MKRAVWTLVFLVGCGEGGHPTWYEDVKPIVQENCAGCHYAGGIAPFALETAEEAAAVAPLLATAVTNKTMPPFGAQDTDDCTPPLPWMDDLRLTDAEIATIQEWADNGAPAGKEKNAVPDIEPVSLEVGEPDLDLAFSEPFPVDGEADQFICFVLDPGNTERKWIDEIQLTPGNNKVAHHGLIFQDVDGVAESADSNGTFDCFDDVNGFLMATWTPGAVPMRTPESAGMPLEAGAKIVVQMHYHPTGDGVEYDQSSVQLSFMDEEPEWAAAQALIGNNGRQYDDGTGLQPGPNDDGSEPVFLIPAGVSNHTETMLYTQDIPTVFPVFAVGTHMHYLGTDMKVELEKADGTKQCLIETPNWDFNWQRAFTYDAPVEDLPTVGYGDSLRLTCEFDNTMDNPFVRRALAEAGLTEPMDTPLGDETLDEMCLALVGILVVPEAIDELY